MSLSGSSLTDSRRTDLTVARRCHCLCAVAASPCRSRLERALTYGLAQSDKHVLPPGTTDFKAASDKARVYLATASADRLDLFQPLTVQDLRLSGHVCFAGTSSMEVFIKMEGLRGGEPVTLMLGACCVLNWS